MAAANQKRLPNSDNLNFLHPDFEACRGRSLKCSDHFCPKGILQQFDHARFREFLCLGGTHDGVVVAILLLVFGCGCAIVVTFGIGDRFGFFSILGFGKGFLSGTPVDLGTWKDRDVYNFDIERFDLSCGHRILRAGCAGGEADLNCDTQTHTFRTSRGPISTLAQLEMICQKS